MLGMESHTRDLGMNTHSFLFIMISLITIRYNNLSYKIDDINWDMNPESTFTNSKGETMSFIDYYKKQYGLDIADRKQPLLINRPTKKGLTEAEADRTICLIPG